MLNLFKENIKITNDNIILATPLIVFMWLSSLYISYSKGAVNSLPLLILTGVTTLFMTSAFLAGWFYMVKKAIQLSKQVFVLDTDKAKATLNLNNSNWYRKIFSFFCWTNNFLDANFYHHGINYI